MSYQRKTVDTYELQANYGFGHGWEVEIVEATYKLAREQKKCYLENAPQYAYRIKLKREPIMPKSN